MKVDGVFITGFPGFIAGRLVGELVGRQSKKTHYYLLVQSQFVGRAEAQCQTLQEQFPALKGNWTIVEGDITRRGLGIADDELAGLLPKIARVWHLAAVYDLSVSVSVAYAVNVEGTMHLLDFCERLPNLDRLLYISTCYVAGDRKGLVLEPELDRGQGFKNHYESTKHWAEKLVQHRADRVPSVIFRPAIVVGDSNTGETIKGDGPYFVFNLLMRLPRWVPMLYVGNGEATVNVVPVNFLVQAMAVISAQEDAAGKVFQLSDPRPKTANELMALSVHYMHRAPVIGTVSSDLVDALVAFKPMERLVGIPKEALSYFNHPADFDCSNTLAALHRTDVLCPDLADYMPTLITYARRHPEIFATVH